MLVFCSVAILLSAFLSTLAVGLASNEAKSTTTKVGKKPHSEDARLVLKLVSQNALKAYTHNTRAGRDHYKEASKDMAWQWAEGYLVHKTYEEVVSAQENHLKKGELAWSEADRAAKTSWIIGSTIKGVKVTGTGSKVAKDVLRLVAKHEHQTYKDNMKARADQYNQIRILENKSSDEVSASELRQKAWGHYKQTWSSEFKAKDAAKMNRLIASTIKNVDTTHRPRFNDFRRWGYEPSESDLSRVSLPSGYSPGSSASGRLGEQQDPPPKSSRTHSRAPSFSPWDHWTPYQYGGLRPSSEAKQHKWWPSGWGRSLHRSQPTYGNPSTARSQSLGGFSSLKSSLSSVGRQSGRSSDGGQSLNSRLLSKKTSEIQSPKSNRSLGSDRLKGKGKSPNSSRFTTAKKQSPKASEGKESQKGEQIPKDSRLLKMSRGSQALKKSQQTKRTQSRPKAPPDNRLSSKIGHLPKVSHSPKGKQPAKRPWRP